MKRKYLLSSKILGLILLVPVLYFASPYIVRPIAGYYHTWAYQKRLEARKAISGVSYYISSSGDDRNDGRSISTSWRTIEKINATVFNPGDSILLEGGRAFSGNILFGKEDIGTADNPITLGSYGKGKAVIKAEQGNAIDILNTQGFHITNLTIVGAGRESHSRSGISVVNDMYGDIKLQYIHIDSIDVSGFAYWGILIDGNEGKSGFRDVLIEYCQAHDNGDAGVYIYGDYTLQEDIYAHENVTIRHVAAYDNTGQPDSDVNTGSGIVMSDTDRGLIECCVAYNNGALCHAERGGPVGIWAWDSRAVIIQYNESYNNKTGSSKDGGGFDLDGGMVNSVMQYNYSHDNAGAGYFLAQFTFARKFTGNIIRYNISHNDGRKNNYGGIEIWGACENNYIYNNTVYVSPVPGSSPAALIIRPNDELGKAKLGIAFNTVIANNIFITSGNLDMVRTVEDTPGLWMINNNYFAENSLLRFAWNGKIYSSLPEWRQATSQEKDGSMEYGFTVDPQLKYKAANYLLVSDTASIPKLVYDLQADSPMINSGIDVLGVFKLASTAEVDFKGIRIPQDSKYDIGACEYLP